MTTATSEPAPPDFPQKLGHPRPLWMLFMAEFWERFAFYGIRWAMTLYVVAEFYQGASAGEKPANELYGAYLALVYAAAIFGGYVADKIIGYQRSTLLGAVIMGTGFFMTSVPNPEIFRLGLATIIVGNGLFKPIISTLVGKLYAQSDVRRDSGFTIFYMGINLGAMIAPVVTQALAKQVFGTPAHDAYKVVFLAAGVGMLISLTWFWFGRKQLQGIGAAPPGAGLQRVFLVLLGGAVVGVPAFYALLTIDAKALQFILIALFLGPATMLLLAGIRDGRVARDKVIAMLTIFVFNVLFWMFFEQAGSSFNFLAEKIVDRKFGSWEFPVAWFQSVNSVAIIAFAPILAWLWVRMGKKEPVDPAQVRPGPHLQWPGVPLAHGRAVQVRRSGDRADPVLDAVHGLRDPVDRRALPVADRPVDDHQARAGAAHRLRDGRLVPVGRDWQQPVRHLRRLGERQERHDRGVGPLGIHLRVLGAPDVRHAAVSDRAADQQADARREVAGDGEDGSYSPRLDRWPRGEVGAVGGGELGERPVPGRLGDQDEPVGGGADGRRSAAGGMARRVRPSAGDRAASSRR